jgi:hypothetical protein
MSIRSLSCLDTCTGMLIYTQQAFILPRVEIIAWKVDSCPDRGWQVQSRKTSYRSRDILPLTLTTIIYTGQTLFTHLSSNCSIQYQ